MYLEQGIYIKDLVVANHKYIVQSIFIQWILKILANTPLRPPGHPYLPPLLPATNMLSLCPVWPSESERCSVVSEALRLHGLYSPWNSPDQNTGVASLSLLQGIFPTQGLNPGLPHCGWVLYQLSHKGSLLINHSYLGTLKIQMVFSSF